MAIRLDNPTPEEMNYLRQIYAMNGGGSDTAMSGSFDAPPQQNALAQMARPQQSYIPGSDLNTFARGTGVLQSTNPDGTQNDPIQIGPPAARPMDPNALKPGQKSVLVPYVGRVTFDQDGSISSPPGTRNMSQPQIDIPGIGRGYYGQDGKMYGPDGQRYFQPRELARVQEAQDRAMNIEKTQAEITGKGTSDLLAQEHIRASKINYPDYHIGDTAGLTGEAALSGVDPGTASIVKAYAEGKMAFPGGAAMRSPRMMQLLTLVGQYDPSFDATDFNLRNKTAADFSSGGKSGQKVKEINQALHHAGALSESVDSLNNTNILPGIINPIVNYAEQKLGGDTRQGTFKMNADALAAELRKVYSSAGGGSLSELKDWQSSFDLNAGQDQQRAYLQKGMQLLNGAIDSLRDNYTRGMGPKADFGKLISPTARADLDRVMGGNKEGSSSSNDVTLPDGRVVTFPNAAAADAYRKAKGQ